MATSSRIMRHAIKHSPQIASTITTYQYNTFGMWWNGRFSGCAANLQHPYDVIMSIWTKHSEECFLHLVESMPWKIKAFLEAKGGKTPSKVLSRYCITNKVAMSEYDFTLIKKYNFKTWNKVCLFLFCFFKTKQNHFGKAVTLCYIYIYINMYIILWLNPTLLTAFL